MLTRLSFEQAIEYEELPNDIYNLIVEDAVACYGEVDDYRTVSIAVFSNTVNINNTVTLRFIGVDKDYRNKGKAKELFSYCEDELKKLRATGIYVKLNEDIVRLFKNHDFLLAFKFIPVATSGHSIEYNLEELKHTPLFTQVIPRLSHFPKTEAIAAWSNHILEYFLRTNRENGLVIKKNSQDPKMSRMYIRNGFAEAALFVARQEDGFIINQLFLEEGVSAKLVIPALIAGSVQDMLEERSEGKLRFHVYHDSYYAGIVAMLGSPKVDDRIVEYYYTLS